MKEFFAKWWYTIAVMTITITTLIVLVAASIACTGFIRVLAIALATMHVIGIIAVVYDTFSRKPPMTIEETFAEAFCEYKRDEDEDRA